MNNFLNNYKTTLRDYIYVLTGAGLSRGFSFLSSILVARWLGAGDFGKFSLFYIAMDLTWQFAEAFDTTFIVYAKATEATEEKKVLIRTSVFTKVLYTGALICISLPIIYFFARCHAAPDRGIMYFVALGVVAGAFLSFLRTILNYFREKEEFGRFTLLGTAHTAIIFLALLVVYGLDYSMDISEATNLYLLVALVVGCVSFGVVCKYSGNVFVVDRSVLKKSLAFGKWVFGYSLIFFLFQRVDTVFLTHYVSYEDIGIYSVAVQLIMIISLATGTLNAIFLPKSIPAIHSMSTLTKYLKEAYLPIGAILFVLLLMIAGAPYLIGYAYGNAYTNATPVLRILLIGWFFNIIYLPVSFFFLALNDSRVKFVLELCKLVLVMGLMFVFVPQAGIIGAAVSVAIALILNSVASTIIVAARIKSNFSRVH